MQRRKSSRRLSFESLESRRFLTALTVYGTDNADGFGIESNALGTIVRINGTAQGLADQTEIDIFAKGGDDTIDLTRVASNLTIVVDCGDGNDVVTVTPADSATNNLPKTLTIKGGIGNGDSVYMNDGATADAKHQYDIDPSGVKRDGIDRVHLASIEILDFTVAASVNTIDVDYWPKYGTLNIRGNAESDTLRLGPDTNNLANLYGAVTFDGGDGSANTVQMFDSEGISLDSPYIIADGKIDRSGSAASLGEFAFNRVGYLWFEAPNNKVDIVHLYAMNLAIKANVNTVTTLSNRLEDISGHVTITGSGHDQVLISDANGSHAQHYFLGVTSFTSDGGFGGLKYSNVGTLKIVANPGAYDLRVYGGNATTAYSVSGIYTLLGPNTNTTWLIDDPGEGVIAGMLFFFQNVYSIRGGSGVDTFEFADQAYINSIDAGAGRDTIDCSAWTSDLVLDLNSGSCSIGPISALYTNFESAYGGSGNDVILGNFWANVLVGGPGNDVISGLGGNDTVEGDSGFDLLFGGNGTDAMLGGAGQDLVLGGRTTFEASGPVLFNMGLIWGDASLSYATRVARLRQGIGTTPINTTTVLNDQGTADALTGGTEQDWYYAGPGDLLKDRQANEARN